MTTLAAVRRFAVSLPATTEEPHLAISSFRVRGRIFATVPDPRHLHLMIASDEVSVAIAIDAQAFEELWWGKRLVGVRVTLARATMALLSRMVTSAWRRKAPAAIRKRFDAGRRSCLRVKRARDRAGPSTPAPRAWRLSTASRG